MKLDLTRFYRYLSDRWVRSFEWHRAFAFVPRVVNDGDAIVWLRFYQRRRRHIDGWYYDAFVWERRA